MAVRENKLLDAVHVPLKIWLFFIIITYIICRVSLPHTYTTNEFLTDYNSPIEILGVMVSLLTTVIHGDEAKSVRWNKIKFFVFIILSVFLLGSIVFLSGGWIDSPFTAPISLYVGYFILLQEDKLTDRTYFFFNSALVLFGIVLILLPYFLLWRRDYPMYILRWEESAGVTWGRLALNIILVIITVGIGQWVGDRVDRIRR